MRSACKSRGATFRSIIGTGDRRIMNILSKALSDGKIRAVIDSTFPMKKAADAMAYQRKGRAAGKVVINIFSEHATKK